MRVAKFLQLVYAPAVTIAGSTIWTLDPNNMPKLNLPIDKLPPIHLPSSKTIRRGQVFDCQWRTYDLGPGFKCDDHTEKDDSFAVFLLEKGATLKNCFIGPLQSQGVQCLEGDCLFQNVHFLNVCEDAFTIRGNGNAVLENCSGQNAVGKIVQHNGCGQVTISGFYASGFNKLYRACGNCLENDKMKCKRTVVIENSYGERGLTLVGLNRNMGDTAIIRNNVMKEVSFTCQSYEAAKFGGNAKDDGKQCHDEVTAAKNTRLHKDGRTGRWIPRH